MNNSNSPVKYLEARNANQFSKPRLRHVKWFKNMIPTVNNTSENANTEEVTNEEIRTVKAEDITGRFDS